MGKGKENNKKYEVEERIKEAEIIKKVNAEEGNNFKGN